MQLWHPEGSGAAVLPSVSTESRAIATQPRRLLSLPHRQKTQMRPEQELRSRLVPEYMRQHLHFPEITGKTRKGTGGSYGGRECNELLKYWY